MFKKLLFTISLIALVPAYSYSMLRYYDDHMEETIVFEPHEYFASDTVSPLVLFHDGQSFIVFKDGVYHKVAMRNVHPDIRNLSPKELLWLVQRDYPTPYPLTAREIQRLPFNAWDLLTFTPLERAQIIREILPSFGSSYFKVDLTYNGCFCVNICTRS